MNKIKNLAGKLADETNNLHLLLSSQSMTDDLTCVSNSLETIRQQLDEVDIHVQEKRGISAVFAPSELRELWEQALQRMVHTSLTGAFILHANGQVIDANNLFLEPLGYSREELVAGAVCWDALTPPEFREWDEQALAELAEHGHCRPHEKEFIRKDGSQVPVLVSAANLDDSGYRRLTYALDLSRSKQADKAISNLTAIMEGSEDAIITVSVNDEVTSWNPAAQRLYGYSAEEVIGESIQFFIPPEHLPRYGQVQKEALAGERVPSFETDRIHKNGSRVHVALTISPIRDKAGEIVGTTRIAHDITARRQLESEFRQAQKMEAIGKLSGGIAHDFNNLLTIIAMHTELALDIAQESDPVLAEYIGEIERAGTRAASLTRQLLAFSRRQMLSPKNLSLNVVIAGMERMLRRLIGEDIILSTILSPDAGRITIDPGQLEQIIMNLSVNARDAMPRGGELTIETRNVELDSSYAEIHSEIVPGPYVLLAFTDTGCGMDSQTRMQVFEPFFTTKAPGEGTGLGLSTVYGIVKQSGGHVSVYSEVGQGTTFKIYVPRNSKREVVPQPEPPAPQADVSETVLLVEDEPTLRKVAADVLTKAGYHVLEATNGKEASTLTKEYSGVIHLLLTDVVMPSMSGSELAESLAKARPEMKVLYMSGYTDNTIIRHGIRDSETNFLQKPFSPLCLLGKVRNSLDLNGN